MKLVFGQVKVGQWFSFLGSIYMKIHFVDSREYKEQNAVCVEDGIYPGSIGWTVHIEEDYEIKLLDKQPKV